MDFWFDFLDIHINEKTTTCHNWYDFKWKKINIYPILIFFLQFDTFFDSLDCDCTYTTK